ncbi:MAG: hypothetical protein V8S22_08390, partial [Lachnospiraceae bacterium]
GSFSFRTSTALGTIIAVIRPVSKRFSWLFRKVARYWMFFSAVSVESFLRGFLSDNRLWQNRYS